MDLRTTKKGFEDDQEKQAFVRFVQPFVHSFGQLCSPLRNTRNRYRLSISSTFSIDHPSAHHSLAPLPTSAPPPSSLDPPTFNLPSSSVGWWGRPWPPPPLLLSSTRPNSHVSSHNQFIHYPSPTVLRFRPLSFALAFSLPLLPPAACGLNHSILPHIRYPSPAALRPGARFAHFLSHSSPHSLLVAHCSSLRPLPSVLTFSWGSLMAAHLQFTARFTLFLPQCLHLRHPLARSMELLTCCLRMSVLTKPFSQIL